MSSSTRNQRKAARRAARDGASTPKKPLIHNRAMQTIEAFAFDKDVTRFLESPAPCPSCGAPLKTTHSLEQGGAAPGAFTVCIKCAGVSQFDVGMKLKAVSDADVEALPPEFRKVVEDLQALVRHVKLNRGRTKSVAEA